MPLVPSPPYRRFGSIALTLTSVALMVASIAPVLAQSPVSTDAHRMIERTISVSAQGHASAAPDRASISTGIQTEAETAREAMARNTSAMMKLIEGLKALGIASKDIQTTAIQVNPRYGNPRDGKPPVINGYAALNQVRIVVTDIKKIGDVLDGALALGANQMGGISFDISTGEVLQDEARKAAMINARRRAELYASAAGVTLGSVLTISEDVRTADQGPFQGRLRGMAAGAAVPVETGAIDLEATVHVTWALK